MSMTRIGLFACAFRLPGADHQGALHAVLSAPSPQTQAAPPDRPFPEGALNPAVSRAGSFLERVWDFAPARFGLSDEDARWMDPQQRLALELGAEALERAGHPKGSLGVFLGVSHDDFHELVRDRLDRVPAPTSTITGCLRNLIGARVGWQLDRPGPAVVVDSACASSLVAIHLARRALESGDCELALAGGVYLALTGTPFRVMSRAGALSPSGLCRPFDERADGLVMGEGGAVFVLGRESLADRLGRGPLAWIAGGALGGDGRTRAPVVPNPKAQIEVMRAAWADAGRPTTDCDAVEAHGTGTRLGDLAEASSLCAVFPKGTPVGSVKSQLGHLMSAAGAAAVVKILCTFTTGTLYPSLGAERPVAALGGLRVPQAVEAFEGKLVGVSSFGFGGTNAHLVLERPEGPIVWGEASAPGPRRHLPLPDRDPPRLTPGPLLDAHTVQGRALWPGAASVDLLLRGGGARALEGLRWWRPITGHAEFVSDGALLRVMEGERLCAEARVSEALHVPPPPAWREDGEALAPETLYAELRALGMSHGPIYQRVRALRFGPGWAVAEVEGLSAPEFVLHPAALDAVFQAVAGLAQGSSLRIPAGARRIVRLGGLDGRLRVITAGRPEDAAIWVLGEDGQIVLYVEGFSLLAPPGVRAFAPRWTPIDLAPEAPRGGLELKVSADETVGLVEAVLGLGQALLNAPPGRVSVRASGRLAWALVSWAWGLGQERPELSVTACAGDAGDAAPPDVAGRLRWVDGRWCRLSLAPTGLDEAPELGPRVLILGGTGGVGRALARAWDTPGRTLHLVGRRAEVNLEGLGSGGATIVLHSTQLPEGIVELLARVGPVDLIVHAAGVMFPGAARRQTAAATAETFTTKVGVAEALAAALGDAAVPVVLMSSSSAAREGQAAGARGLRGGERGVGQHRRAAAGPGPALDVGGLGRVAGRHGPRPRRAPSWAAPPCVRPPPPGPCPGRSPGPG
jgi:3-oxoacyl-(acyl-carrier-protein) synthase